MSWESTTTAVLHPRRTACQGCGATKAARHTERGWKTSNGPRWLCADCANAARMTAQGIATNRRFSGEGKDDLLRPSPKCVRCGWRDRRNRQCNEDGIPRSDGTLTLCAGCAALAREKAKTRRKADAAPASPIPRQAVVHTVKLEQHGAAVVTGTCQHTMSKPPKKKYAHGTSWHTPEVRQLERRKGGPAWQEPCPNRAVVIHEGVRYCEAHARSLGLEIPPTIGKSGVRQQS